ncbi:hypothetical protein DL98DRAFT_586381 [Cadophora sp. DSE1049]|nr:hypothetical protein DL98DRAFT_586381 [Cadophora sp. DSE1049]
MDLNIDQINAMEMGESSKNFVEESRAKEALGSKFFGYHDSPRGATSRNRPDVQAGESHPTKNGDVSRKSRWKTGGLVSKGQPSFWANIKQRKLFPNTNERGINILPTPSRVRKFEETPDGYPKVSVMLTSDPHLMVYRSFNYLQSRLLLHKQDELRELEDGLDVMDRVDSRDNPRRLIAREEDDKLDGKRKELFDETEVAFNEYAILLINARKIVNFNSLRDRDLKQVRDWFDETKPIRKHECFIYHEKDLLSLQKGRLDSWLDIRIENFLRKHDWRVLRLALSTPDLGQISESEKSGVEIFSRTRINRLKLTIILTAILAHFAGPVYLLWYMARKGEGDSTPAISVGILLTFTCTFSIVLSQFLSEERHELLAAAAA